jgi:hypothetical protein
MQFSTVRLWRETVQANAAIRALESGRLHASGAQLGEGDSDASYVAEAIACWVPTGGRMESPRCRRRTRHRLRARNKNEQAGDHVDTSCQDHDRSEDPNSPEREAFN